VHPDLLCVWVVAFERAEQAGHGVDLDRLQRPVDHRRWGESSWVNYWQGRDALSMLPAFEHASLFAVAGVLLGHYLAYGWCLRRRLPLRLG
jgi:hypothetical protein